ncbi:MAG: LytTR family DNA-binding domain-containing protein [Acidobacteriaceae bacterium]
MIANQSIRVLVVDDEPLARTGLLELLKQRVEVSEIDEARDAPQALEMMLRAPYDLVLLDIQMPEIGGLELIDTLQRSGSQIPNIIFVTAFLEHAIAAFERQALDYILKPFTPERVHQAISRATQRSNEERAARLLKLMPYLKPGARSKKIGLKVDGRILFVSPTEIIAVEAQGNYVLLQQQTGTLLLRESVSDIADKLAPHGFVRIHRSVLVNTTYVESVQPSSTGEYLLRLKNGKEYNVTRTYKHSLRLLADSWVGMDDNLGVQRKTSEQDAG